MSAAEKFVTERNREIRMSTAEKDSIEHQVTVEEVAIAKGAAEIDKAVAKMREEGRLTEKAIAEERIKLVEAWDKKSQQAVESVANRVSGFDDGFEPRELDQTKMLILAQQFQSLDNEQRMDWIKQARTGANEEIALFFVHAPETLTKITGETRSAISDIFRTEKQIIKAERKRDLLYRGEAVLDVYETTRRRMINAN